MKQIFLVIFVFFFFQQLVVQAQELNNSTVIKPNNDHRDYKFIKLENGIEAILVSDPKAQKSAAAINIGVGSFEDPEEIAGLNHFLEHLLFLGNSKYPIPKEYGEFLNKHGGYHNAYTSSQNTNYHFSVNYQYLEPALDRLSQFFISPLFDEKYVKKEINAVNAEHQKNLQFEFRRSYAVLKEIANPEHPFSRFSTGNSQTLEIVPNLREKVIELYEKYYSTNLMQISVLGRESLADLEKLVTDKFGAIAKKATEVDRYKGRVYPKENLPFSLRIQSLKNVRNLHLYFEIDSVRQKFREKPIYYISSLLGHEAEGSLLSYLKQKEWAISLSSGLSTEHTKSSFFAVNIDLTQAGEKNINEIVKAVFSYLYLIKRDGINSWRFDEMKKISNVNFNFQDSPSSLSLVQRLSASLAIYEPENTLNAGWVFGYFNPAVIYKTLDQISLENFFLVYTAPTKIENTKVEKWYGTKYQVTKFTEKELNYWQQNSNKEYLDQFFLPLKNRFILSQDPTLLPATEETDVIKKLPKKYTSHQAHYVRNSSFIPKTKITLDLLTKKYYSTPKNSILIKIYTRLLKDALAEALYPAYIVNYRFNLSERVEGLRMVVEGYPEKMDIFLSEILRASTDASFSEVRFLNIKQKILEEWQNIDYSPAYRVAMYEFFQMTQNPFWHYKDYISVLENLTFQDFKKYRTTILNSFQLDFFAYGNVTKDSVKDLIKIIDKNLKFKPIKSTFLKSSLELEKGETITYQRQVTDVNSAVVIAYPAPTRNLATKVKMDFLEIMIADDFYNFIRTQEQLGYLVWSNYSPLLDRNSFLFVVQSPFATPMKLKQKIEEFLVNFQKDVNELSKTDFEDLKSALLETYEQKKDSFSKASGFYYWSVSIKDYKTEHRTLLKQELKKMTKADFIKFYSDLFINSESKKIVVQSFAKDLKINTEEAGIIGVKSTFKQQRKFTTINPTKIFPWVKNN